MSNNKELDIIMDKLYKLQERELQTARKLNVYDNDLMFLREEVNNIRNVLNNYKDVTIEITNKYNDVAKELNELKESKKKK